jgi:hypothetical protein
MRTLALALLFATAAGGAQAQVLGQPFNQSLSSNPFLTSPSLGADALQQQRLQMEIDRLQADQRSAAAAQFRFQASSPRASLRPVFVPTLWSVRRPTNSRPIGSRAEARKRLASGPNGSVSSASNAGCSRCESHPNARRQRRRR